MNIGDKRLLPALVTSNQPPTNKKCCKRGAAGKSHALLPLLEAIILYTPGFSQEILLVLSFSCMLSLLWSSCVSCIVHIVRIVYVSHLTTSSVSGIVRVVPYEILRVAASKICCNTPYNWANSSTE